LSHPININHMPQIGAASSYEEPWGHVDQIWGCSEVYRMRSRPDMGVWGPTGTDTAAGTKNAAGGGFSNRVVKGTIGRGRGRVLVPDFEEGDVGMDWLVR
jgi:hypothetical protein